MDELHVRQATLNDLAQIRDVLIKSHWFTYEKLFAPASIEKMIERYYNTERLTEEITYIDATWHGYIVAVLKHRIVGVIGGGMRDADEGEVYVLYLDPKMRNKGIGSQLLNKLTTIQKFSYGAKEQWVAVAQGNEYAIPFYEARRFTFQYASPSYAAIDDNDVSLWYNREI